MTVWPQPPPPLELQNVRYYFLNYSVTILMNVYMLYTCIHALINFILCPFWTLIGVMQITRINVLWFFFLCELFYSVCSHDMIVFVCCRFAHMLWWALEFLLSALGSRPGGAGVLGTAVADRTRDTAELPWAVVNNSLIFPSVRALPLCMLIYCSTLLIL